MSIRLKIIFVVLPLVVAPLLLTGVISTLSARNGITSIATGFLQFKAEQLTTYAEGQWSLLTANGLETQATYVEATKAAVETFARSLVRSATEWIFALDPQGRLDMQSTEKAIAPEELTFLAQATGQETGWRTLDLAGVERVAHVTTFEPFQWTIYVSEETATFFRTTDQIVRQTGYILGGSLAISLALLLLFAAYITHPLRQVVDAMTDIISKNDLSRRVEVLYHDETGKLGHTFNLMSMELEKAYGEIKSYALRAAVAQLKEQKIRHIFQKYVPRDVIEQFFANPEQMLVGENRVLAVLFSDVRSFTTISERLRPEEIVDSLNHYFALMVDVVMNRGGIVDKYIGDAVMAFFGAPVRHEDDALQSVLSGLEMLDALKKFNVWQVEKGRHPFEIGVGISYGAVTVGNIGSERKMDYTVIGDQVNLGSRLESLTKRYHEPIIISEPAWRKVKDTVPCRLLDRVIVKGRSKGSGIYSARRELSEAEREGWKAHEEALALYYDRKFGEAAAHFSVVTRHLPQDHCARLFLERCAEYQRTPPGEDWTGLVEMTEK